MASNEDYILEILQETGLVTKSQLERARNDRQGTESLGDTLVRQGVLTQEDQMRALAAHAAMDFVDLSQIAIPEEITQLLPPDVAKRFKRRPHRRLR